MYYDSEYQYYCHCPSHCSSHCSCIVSVPILTGILTWWHINVWPCIEVAVYRCVSVAGGRTLDSYLHYWKQQRLAECQTHCYYCTVHTPFVILTEIEPLPLVLYNVFLTPLIITLHVYSPLSSFTASWLMVSAVMYVCPEPLTSTTENRFPRIVCGPLHVADMLPTMSTSGWSRVVMVHISIRPLVCRATVELAVTITFGSGTEGDT